MDYTYIKPNNGDPYAPSERVEYDETSLSDVNRIRVLDGMPKLNSLQGYCMSSGCSCGTKLNRGNPVCGLFKSYDDGIKKDFLYHILGL